MKRKLKINLSEIFGVTNMPNNSALRQQIGEAIIEQIRKKTESGKQTNPDGKAFAKYSSEYKESDDFEIYGKQKNKINMKLTGDMLSMLDIIEETKNTITLGWDDEEQEAKAENHLNGVTVPKRDFLWIDEKMKNKIQDEFIDEVITIDEIEASKSSDKITEILNLIKAVKSER